MSVGKIPIYYYYYYYYYYYNRFTVLLDFVRDYPDEPVPEETFTHSHLS